jgi:hypothetical protein
LKSLIEKWARPVFNKSHRHVTGGEEAPARVGSRQRQLTFGHCTDVQSVAFVFSVL